MKNLLYFLAVGLFMFSSCADEELSPVITFEKAEKGAYPRLVQLVSGEYDLANISGSAFAYEVEFVDEQQGDLVGQYDIYVSYTDNDASNGDNSQAQQLYQSFSSSEFKENDRGFKGLDISLPLTDVAAKMGIDVNTISAGDIFAFSTEVIKTDGAKFTAANSSSAVRGSAFQGFFTFNSKATCPVSDDRFSGSYTLDYVAVEALPFGAYPLGEPGKQIEITTVSGSSTLREFQFVWIEAGGFGQAPSTMRFDLVCDITTVAGEVDGGLTCGAGAVTLGPDADNNQAFDLGDDSEILLAFEEYVSDGGCGVPTLSHVAILTKN